MMLAEITIACLTLMGEASICNETEMRAVARTMQVRSEDRKMTIRQVCLQPKQYSCWNGFKAKRKILRDHKNGTIRRSPAWRQAQRVALDMHAKQLNILPRWTHYYRADMPVPPTWAKQLTQTAVIGHHVFGRIN
jgi:spore germination cell wall hydrolase CwlJ-like protein